MVFLFLQSFCFAKAAIFSLAALRWQTAELAGVDANAVFGEGVKPEVGGHRRPDAKPVSGVPADTDSIGGDGPPLRVWAGGIFAKFESRWSCAERP